MITDAPTDLSQGDVATGEQPVDGTLTPVAIPLHPEQSEPFSRIEVDFGDTTGPVHGGATGMLYGLSDPGVPARQLISGARPRTVAQKSPGGQQHPNGDALEIVVDFVAAGGSEVLVYLQDDYAQWPYEFLGINDYVRRVTERVRSAMASEHHGAFAWVPFNEPDWIWYADWATERERFCEHWRAIHAAIRSEDPTGRIVGPNEMEFRPSRLRDFLGWAAQNNVLPDVMSWHELEPASLGTFDEHLTAYRALERDLGIGPLPINIDEYGNRRDMSVPGQMVQWIALFERAKVDADIAYWTMAGNLDDHAVQTTGANGGWWLLFWYARLAGETCAVRPPYPGIPDTLQAVAAIDAVRRTGTVILGGTGGDIELNITGTAALASALGLSGDDPVRIVVEETRWSGQEGHALPPRVVSITEGAPLTDTVVVPIQERDRMAAYRVTLSAAVGEAPQLTTLWEQRLEAEHAVVVHGDVSVHNDDAQKYAASGGRDVTGLMHADSSVTFTTDVPRSSEYELVVTYGTAGQPTRQALVVDNVFSDLLHYPSTLSTDYRGRIRHRITLEAGRHELSLRNSGPDGVVGDVEVSLDRLDVCEVSPATPQPSRYALHDADLGGGALLLSGRAATGGSVVLLTGGASSRFWISAETDGYYELALELSAEESGLVAVAVNGTSLHIDRGTPVNSVPAVLRAVVYLSRGITEVTAQALEGTIMLAGLTVIPRTDADRLTVTGPCDDGGFSQGSGPLTVERPAQIGAGATVVTLDYANGAKQNAENYNTDVVTLRVSVAEARGASIDIPCRHSYSWDNYWTVGAVIDLATDDGALRISALGDCAPNISRVSLSPLVAELWIESGSGE